MIYAYDTEIFKNFFSVVFVNIETGKKVTFYNFDNRDDTEKLRKFLLMPGLTLVGYNSIGFDNLVLQAVLIGLKDEVLFDFVMCIINRNLNDMHYDLMKSFRIPSIDVMKILALDVMGVSLKQVAINIKWPLIQDLPFSPYKIIELDDVDTILKYNENDSQITKALFLEILEDIELRKKVGKTYGVNLINCSDSRMANIILTKIYCQKTGIREKELKDKRTNRSVINLDRCISKKIRFNTEKLSSLLKELKSTKLKEKDGRGRFRFKTSVEFNGVIYDLGVGGLHSRDKPEVFEQDADYFIIDADVASFYPNIILNDRIKPEHLSNSFLDIFSDLTKQRLEAKRKKQILDSEALKITINSVFGKLGSEVFWLYDQQAFYSVTVSGQLFLLMLVEILEENNIKVISANTDGVTALVDKNKYDEYLQICKEWEIKTGFSLEFTKYKKYARRDVNSYVTLKENGKTKTKGIFDIIDGPDKKFSRISGKRFNHPIVAKALVKYFTEGIEPEETVMQSNNIHDFLTSQKAGKKFDIILVTGNTEAKLQRTNRYYFARRGGGKLIKRSPSGRTISIHADHMVTVANDLTELKPIEQYNIDYQYYINEIEKITEMISPKMISMSVF